MGTRLINQSGCSNFVGGLGTHGSQVKIHIWRSSHEIVGKILEDFEGMNAGLQTEPVEKRWILSM